ncbi:methylated-DNA--[protein]-cysteine S-methyltransferase [Haloferula sp.]|uniref:methylated-DNA--[protein]-cysteine S-methyltransferase n=1 Tax=Haloferula sp. TaxID=2497595 RepID=UPI003C71A96E
MKNFPDHATCSREMDSPVGGLVLFATKKGLAGLFFIHRVPEIDRPGDDAANPHLKNAESQLAEYFAKERETFDIDFDRRGTAFQESVWQQLSMIPFGETCSYGDIAKRINNPNSVRAVGLANGSNPISIIVPCHRVIGADGSLTGFGGGLDIKHKLLTHEGLLLGLC